MHFECFKAGSFSADISRVVEYEVASTGDLGSVCFLFLRSDCADDSGKGVRYGRVVLSILR